jgi:hypothetical protein
MGAKAGKKNGDDGRLPRNIVVKRHHDFYKGGSTAGCSKALAIPIVFHIDARTHHTHRAARHARVLRANPPMNTWLNAK